ncbi:uncharacterized protein [Centruroides vittatus]|uniref:uncharacterized protein n=1 Tax=Centruroides vittatus TaxID=120091 RepID=UPI003510C1E0
MNLKTFLLLITISIYLILPIYCKTKDVGQPLFCDGCLAVLKELHKKLKNSMGRKKMIKSSLENLCAVDNFVVYRFSPPKMIKACNYVLENYREELEESLISYYKKYKTEKNLLLQEEFCDRKIKACEGIEKPPEEGLGIRPEGLSVEEANEKLKDMSQIEMENSLEKPIETTTPLSREEL